MKLIRVALPVPLHRYFDYLPLENSIPVKGARVVVPFWEANQSRHCGGFSANKRCAD